MATQEVAQNLLENLKSQCRSYSELLAILETEHQILIQSEVEQLQENNKKKQIVLSQIALFEAARRSQVQQILKNTTENNEIRFSKLVLLLPIELRNDLLVAKEDLILAVQRVTEQNQLNDLMVQSALSLVQGVLNNVRNQFKQASTYQRKGHMDNQPSAGQLVSKEF